MSPTHPLFLALRNGHYWHCTGLKEFIKIASDEAIKPNDGSIKRWGKYACQHLNGVSIFDFTTATEEKIFDHYHKWNQFLGGAEPITIALGIERSPLLGRLVPYPENRDITAPSVIGEIVRGPIPIVETCHCGPIPIAAISTALLINPKDYQCFRVCKSLEINSVMSEAKEFHATFQHRG